MVWQHQKARKKKGEVVDNEKGMETEEATRTGQQKTRKKKGREFGQLVVSWLLDNSQPT